MLKQFSARNRRSPDFYGSTFGGYSDRRPPHSKFEGTKPPKGTFINRDTIFELLSVQFGPKLRPVGWPRKRKKNKKRWAKKVTNRYISPPRGGATSQPMFTKYGEFVDLTDVITPAKFGYKIFIGFFRPRGGKSHFPYRKKAYGLFNSAMRYRAGLWLPPCVGHEIKHTKRVRSGRVVNYKRFFGIMASSSNGI